MRLQHILAFGAAFPLLFFSCSDLTNLTKPESVSVKATDAAYNFSLGRGEVLLSKHLNAEKLSESVSKDDEEDEDGETTATAKAKVDVYDYLPRGESVQQFLFSYQVASIPLDFGEYLKSLDLLSSLGDEMSQDITVPALDTMTFPTSAREDPLPNFSQLVRDGFKIKNPPEIKVPESKDSNGAYIPITDTEPFEAPTITIETPEFGTMTFRDGSIIVTFERTDTATMTGFKCQITKAVLVDIDGTVLSTSDTVPIDIANEDERALEFPLADVTIVPRLRLKIEGFFGGDKLGVVHKYRIDMKLSDDAEVSKVTGLTMNNAALGEKGTIKLNETVPISNPNDFLKSATIEDGSLSFYGALPDGWTGVVCDTDVTVSDGGEFLVRDSEFKDVNADDGKGYIVNKSASLRDKPIDLSDGKTVNMKGTLKIRLENATLVFEPDTDYSVSVVGTVAITKLRDAIVDIDKCLADDALAEKTVNKSLGTVGTYVKTVTFKKLGITGIITSDLATEGMTIMPTVTSNLFGITDAEPLTDEVEVKAGEDATMTLEKDYGDVGLAITPDGDTEADFTVKTAIKGADGTSCVTLREVELGKTYSVKTTLDLSYDWSAITLDVGASDAFKFDGTVETGLDLQSMLDDYLDGDHKDLLDNVAFGNTEADVAAYLCVTRPQGSQNTELKDFPAFLGTITAYYGEADAEGKRSKNKVLLEKTSTNDPISIVDAPAKTFKTLAEKGHGSITEDLFKKGAYSAALTGFSDILNEKPAGLDIEYNIHPSSGAEMTLTREEVDGLKAGREDDYSPSIDIAFNVVIPLALTIKEPGIQIADVLKLAGKEFEEGDDVLKRDDEDDDLGERFEKYGKIVDHILISYQLEQNMGLEMSGKMVLLPADAKDGKGELYYDVTIDNAQHTLYLAREAAERVLSKDSFPFQPAISAKIADGEVTVPHNGYFSAKATFTLVLDGEVTVWGGDDE